MIESCRLALPKHKSASRPVGPPNGSGFGEKIFKAGIAQLTERRSRKAEAGGLNSSCQHHARIAQSVEPALDRSDVGSIPKWPTKNGREALNPNGEGADF